MIQPMKHEIQMVSTTPHKAALQNRKENFHCKKLMYSTWTDRYEKGWIVN